MSDTFVTRRYISAKDQSKAAREILRREFPGVKFSVRTQHHTSVNVSWTDGPTDAAVSAAIGHLAGGWFDGMTDSYNHESDLMANDDGTFEIVSSGAQYVFTRRDISDDWRDEIIRTFADRLGEAITYPDDAWRKVALHVDRDGELYRMRDHQDSEYVADLLHRYTYPRSR